MKRAAQVQKLEKQTLPLNEKSYKVTEARRMAMEWRVIRATFAISLIQKQSLITSSVQGFGEYKDD